MHRHGTVGGRWAAIALTAIAFGTLPCGPARAFDAAKADASVLRIYALVMKGDNIVGGGLGSGFVIDDEYVATNNHVVDQFEAERKLGGQLTFTVTEASTLQRRPARLIWRSPQVDLAVLHVPGLKRAPLTLARHDPYQYPRKGDRVFLIGYPGAAEILGRTPTAKVESSVTNGVVSRTVKTKAHTDDVERPIIQHTAPSSGGNSGGPLFDDCNVVVGVHTYGTPSTLQITTDAQGRQVAVGQANAGYGGAPHIYNLVSSAATAPELRSLRLRLTDAICEPGESATVWPYAVGGLALLFGAAAMVVALRRGTSREVIRVVESYTAYVRRKGHAPSDESLQPRKVSNAPSALGASAAPQAAARPSGAGRGWSLRGRGAKGEINITIPMAQIEQATSGREQGLIIGRKQTLADIVIDDPSVSRRHAKIYATQTGLAIEDLGAAFGTEVNGFKLEQFKPAEIKSGDRLKLGGVGLELAATRG